MFSIFCSVCYIQDLRALDIFGQQWIERSGDYAQEMILNWALACALWLDNHYELLYQQQPTLYLESFHWKH